MNMHNYEYHGMEHKGPSPYMQRKLLEEHEKFEAQPEWRQLLFPMIFFFYPMLLGAVAIAAYVVLFFVWALLDRGNTYASAHEWLIGITPFL